MVVGAHRDAPAGHDHVDPGVEHRPEGGHGLRQVVADGDHRHDLGAAGGELGGHPVAARVVHLRRAGGVAERHQLRAGGEHARGGAAQARHPGEAHRADRADLVRRDAVAGVQQQRVRADELPLAPHVPPGRELGGHRHPVALHGRDLPARHGVRARRQHPARRDGDGLPRPQLLLPRRAGGALAHGAERPGRVLRPHRPAVHRRDVGGGQVADRGDVRGQDPARALRHGHELEVGRGRQPARELPRPLDGHVVLPRHGGIVS